MPYSSHFSDEKIEAYRTRKWAKVSYASHQGWLTHGWVHLAIPPPGGWGLWNHSGKLFLAGMACFLFLVKGSNQQWPLNCDVPIASAGNLIKIQILWQEVWGGTWDSRFPEDVNAVVQGPHFERQPHISPSPTFFQLFTHSKCLVITKCLLCAMYCARSWQCSHEQIDQAFSLMW